MKLSQITPHAIIILLFVLVSFIYFSPVLKGKRIDGHDVKTWIGMSKEISDHRESTGEEALWTNSLFSGMPAYQISVKYTSNLVRYIDKIISLGFPRPANLLFLYLLGFYLLLISLNIDYRIAAIGAFAYAFSSYFFIIIQAGHMTKAHAIAYLPMVVAAVLYTYKRKMLLGGVLTALAVALQIFANHYQITYYLILILLFIGFTQFFNAIKNNDIISFFKRTGVLLLAALLAAGTSFTRLKTTMDYGKETTRGNSELTNNADIKTKNGLDKDYATAWSYGIAESFTLLIPNFHGGASQGELTTDSETYKALKKLRVPNAKKMIKKLPLYWGDQPIVSGPTYAGAIVIFLFIMGLFIVKPRLRSWLLLATIMSLTLAWGKNFMPLTDFFLDHFPGYNKFRAVSMILIIAEFTIPVLAFVALNRFLSKDNDPIIINNNIWDKLYLTFIMIVLTFIFVLFDLWPGYLLWGGYIYLITRQNKIYISKEKVLKYSYYFIGGLTFLFALAPSVFFDFVGGNDSALEKSGWPIDALQSDRAMLLSNDAWRSFIFISLTFATLWMFLKKKIASKYVILIIGLLVITDMWTVNKRYLNNDKEFWISKKKIKVPYKPTQADNFILKDTDPNFRVFNQSVSTFNDVSTSYFHKSIGGYHGAKLKRYQELIEFHISKGNMNVLNMLNTKYFISKDGRVQQNPSALGNAWFISNPIIVKNADEEIAALSDFTPNESVIIDQRFASFVEDSNYNIDGSSIGLDIYKPNYLKYTSESTTNALAVFSEIYYKDGWNVYIDGVASDYFRANYVLRAMQIPSGTHTIEFKFEPSVYKTGENISLASSIILILLLVFVSVKELKQE